MAKEAKDSETPPGVRSGTMINEYVVVAGDVLVVVSRTSISASQLYKEKPTCLFANITLQLCVVGRPARYSDGRFLKKS